MAKFNKLDSCTLSAYHQYSGALALGTVASVDIGAIRAKGTGNAVTDLNEILEVQITELDIKLLLLKLK